MKIAVVGNGQMSKEEIYTKVPAAIDASAQFLDLEVELIFITTSKLIAPKVPLSQIDAIFAYPTPFEDLWGFYNCTQFARENDIPWLGACGATQHAWVEFGINECGIKDGYHIEQQLSNGTVVVDYLPDHYRVSNDGPLKNFSVNLKDDYNALINYCQNKPTEQFFANFSLRNEYSKQFEKTGLRTIGTFEDNQTPCLFEIKNHSYFIGALFQPQMTASLENPHPLITGLLKAGNH